MNQLVNEVRDMLRKRKLRDTPYVDMDGFRVYYEKLGGRK